MSISSIGNSNSLSLMSALTSQQNNTSKESHYNSSLDTVNISSKAMKKYLAMKNAATTQEKTSDIASQVSKWYDNFRQNMGMIDDPDVSAWPVENQQRR